MFIRAFKLHLYTSIISQYLIFYHLTYVDCFILIFIQIICVPRKRFGSAVCVQRYRQIVCMVLQSADLKLFRETAGSSFVFKKYFQDGNIHNVHKSVRLNTIYLRRYKKNCIIITTLNIIELNIKRKNYTRCSVLKLC